MDENAKRLLQLVSERPGISITKAAEELGLPYYNCGLNGVGGHTVERERAMGLNDLLAAGRIVVSTSGRLYPR